MPRRNSAEPLRAGARFAQPRRALSRLLAGVLLAALPPAAVSQDGGLQPFDACGVLVSSAGCVLFEGGGGRYVLVDAGGFDFGDRVRVVGTLNPGCVTICPQADGCLSGVEVVDPDVFPCGTPLPSFPSDVVGGVCPAVAAGVFALTLLPLLSRRQARSDPHESLRAGRLLLRR